MRIELRVCKHCYEGEYGNEQKTAVTQDMIACAREVCEYKDLIGLDGVYVTMVEEGDSGGAEELNVIIASINDDQVTLSDTQLVMEDGDGNMLVYPEPKEILQVLTRNLEQIQEQTRQDGDSESRSMPVELWSSSSCCSGMSFRGMNAFVSTG